MLHFRPSKCSWHSHLPLSSQLLALSTVPCVSQAQAEIQKTFSEVYSVNFNVYNLGTSASWKIGVTSRTCVTLVTINISLAVTFTTVITSISIVNSSPCVTNTSYKYLFLKCVLCNLIFTINVPVQVGKLK